MSEQLRVSLVQAASGLEPADNRELLAKTAAEVPDGTDLAVWPEAFARDFGRAGSDVSAYAETVWGADGGSPGPFADAVARVAEERATTVVAGMFETSDDPARPWNTLAVAGPGGERTSYRKIHLYDSFGYRESDRLSPGPTTPVTLEVGGFTLGLMTCYDLRFPEQARLLVDAGAEVLVLPAAWLAGPGKLHHWRTLLSARAIENTVFVLAAAQPAPRYTGHSLAVDPMGRVLGEAGDEAGRVDVVLERSVLTEARETNPSLANRRL